MKYTTVQELIGNTPLVELTQLVIPNKCRILAKLEFFNPGGSVKDRLGQFLIEDAEKKGLLQEGSTIIEPTAGNTGIGLALAAIGKPYEVICVVPEKFSVEKQTIMRALGAKIVQTPSEQGMQGAIRKASELVSTIPLSFSPSQFSNQANPATYYNSLGPELWQETEGTIDIFVAGAGSGGTFTGTAQFLKEQGAVRTVVVEPEGSILNGGPAGSHETEGIGMEFYPPFIDQNLFDGIYTISDDEAFSAVHALAQQEGLLVGSSSGAALQAALQEAQQAPEGSTIVVIFPDASDRYLSKGIYQERKNAHAIENKDDSRWYFWR